MLSRCLVSEWLFLRPEKLKFQYREKSFTTSHLQDSSRGAPSSVHRSAPSLHVSLLVDCSSLLCISSAPFSTQQPEGPLESAAAVASLHTYSRAYQCPRSSQMPMSAQGLRALTPAHLSTSSHHPLPSCAYPAVHLAGPSSPFWSQIRCHLCRETPPLPTPDHSTYGDAAQPFVFSFFCHLFS